jgi:mannose-1-phosphate guanylyltransferase/phosphomannomutase
MLPIHGRPILEYILCNLAAQGIREIAVNLHFVPEMIRDYFGTGARSGAELTYSYEPELLGTAGAVRKLASFLGAGDSFLVHYGDIVTDQNFGEMREAHHRRNALASILLHRRLRSNSIVTLGANSRVVDFLERPAPNTSVSDAPYWVNSGVYICSPSVIERIPETGPADFPRDIFPGLVLTGRLFGFPLSGYRCAVDSAARLQEATDAIGNGTCRIALPPAPGPVR